MKQLASSAVARISLSLLVALASAHTPVWSQIPTGSLTENPQALNQAGAAALSAGEYDGALAAFNRAARLAPHDPGIAFNIGLTYLRMNKYPQAIEPLRRAVADPALSANAHFLLGTALYGEGQLETAIAELELVRSHPAYAETVLYMLEECYRRTRKPEGAQKAFFDLNARYPDSALLHKLLGIAYDAASQNEEALKEFQRAAEVDPSLAEVRFAAGLSYLKLHDDAHALQWFRDELAVNACHAASLYFAGAIQRKWGNLDDAVDSFRRAVQCDRQYADAYLALGMALHQLGHDGEALPILRRAVDLSPDKPAAHYQLARVLAKAGQANAARLEFQKIKDQFQGLAEQGAATMEAEMPKAGSIMK